MLAVSPERRGDEFNSRRRELEQFVEWASPNGVVPVRGCWFLGGRFIHPWRQEQDAASGLKGVQSGTVVNNQTVQYNFCTTR